MYFSVGKDIDNGNTKDGLSKIFDFINYSNKYFDENEPWKLVKADTSKCKEVLYNCSNIIFNINNLLKPYLVETTKKVEEYLNTCTNNWEYEKLGNVDLNHNIAPLFIRYDKIKIEEEKINLKNINN